MIGLDTTSTVRDGASASIFALSLITVVSVLLHTAWTMKRKRAAGPSFPPGPMGLPLLGSLPFLSPELHRWFAGLARAHGPVLGLRLGTKRCVVLTSPSAAREVLKDHDAVFANHDPPATALICTYGGVDMLWAPYGPHWRMVRKVSVRELLSAASIESLRPLRRREVRRAVAWARSREGEAVEARELAFATALGVMRSMLWGGAEADEEEEGMGRELRVVIDGIVEMLGAANVSDFFPAVARWDLQGFGRRMKRLSARFDRIFESIMDMKRRRQGGAKSKDFLQVMLDLLDRGDPDVPLRMNHVKALLLDLVSAGTDTTTTTVEWALTELLHNPDTMRKAQEELDGVVGKDRVVEESDIPRLAYLDAVVKEVLRLHPPVPLLIPHCPSSPCTVGGHTVPKGAQVYINVWAIHRDPSLWEDPSEFRPERFLDSGEKYDYSGGNFNYLPFGSGRRVCVGVSLAVKMIMYMLASLLHSFEWRLPDGADLELSDKFGIVLKKKELLVVVPTSRLGNPELYA